MYAIVTKCPFCFQNDWNTFLTEIDEKNSLELQNEILCVEDYLPKDLEFYCVQKNATLKLGDYFGSKSILIILLRHLSWLPWRDHVAQLKEQKVKMPR